MFCNTNYYMKQLILIAAICYGSMREVHSQCFPVDTAKLNQACRDLMNNPKTFQLEKAFFDAFPSSWMEFILTYQFHPGKNYDMSMNFLYSEHISAFGKLSFIPDSTYCDKLINLAIGGKWFADYVSSLQTVIHNTMDEKTAMFFSRLSKRSSGYQLRFWMFFWSSFYHPEDGGSLGQLGIDYPVACEKYKNKMGKTYPENVKIMETALPFALGEILWPYGAEEDFPHLYLVK